MSLEKLVKNTGAKLALATAALAPLYSCQGLRTADYVSAGANTLLGGPIAGVRSLADSEAENYRAKAGAPVVNVYGNSGATQQIGAPIDWENIMLDPRVSDVAKHEDRSLFILNMGGQKDLYLLNSNGSIDRLTSTTNFNESNPSWYLENGKESGINYDIVHIRTNECNFIKESTVLRNNFIWEPTIGIVNYCTTHRADGVISEPYEGIKNESGLIDLFIEGPPSFFGERKIIFEVNSATIHMELPPENPEILEQ